MIDRFEKFSLAIAEISRCWHKIAAEELAKYSLKSSHVTYLLTLYRYPEGLTAPRLAELCDRVPHVPVGMQPEIVSDKVEAD